MKQNKSYEVFLEILLNRFPDKKTLVNHLVEILHIEKDVAYRRLRGTVPFSFTEITTIAVHFDISLDNIMAIGNQNAINRPLKLTNIDYQQPKEIDYYMLNRFVQDIQQMDSYKESEFISIANTIPQPFYTRYLHIYRFYLLKWEYEDGKTHIRKPFRDIHPPEELIELNKKYRDNILKANNITFIWDKNTLQMLEEDIRYFYDIHLITREEVELIKGELNELVDELESLTINGCFPNKKQARFYVSNISIKGSYNILSITPDYKLSMIKWFTINDTIAADKSTYKQMKEWMFSLQRTSTLISQSGEIQRIRFFNEQRKLIRLLDNL